jgi:hypothetical protein
MSKWLDRLREHEKNRRMRGNETLKTFKTPEMEVSRVLRVRSGQESANFSSPADDAQAAFDERAGILEYDCGLPRDKAERLARIQISSTLH